MADPASEYYSHAGGAVMNNHVTAMSDDAFHGLAGEIINLIAPHTEADKNGLMVQLLAAVGNAIGPHVHYRVESTTHHMNLFVVIVGDTSKSRKGTSWNWINRIVRMADDDWHKCQANGMSSGEGIIYQVRDTEDEIETPDRRLMIVEGEFAQALKVARREGNTLSPVLRNAWDGGVLRTLTKNSPIISTGAHISIIGHITEEELLNQLNEVEMANGLGNRFLWVSVTRSKLLPFGGIVGDEQLTPLAYELRQAFAVAHDDMIITMDDAACNLWASIYEELSESAAGLVGSMTARMEAQLIRVACVYAVLDRSRKITVDHLKAARAVIDYCDKSVRHIFSTVTGNPIADRILGALQTEMKLTRTAVSQLGAGHWRKHQIEEAINILVEDHGVVEVSVGTTGRPKKYLTLDKHAHYYVASV